MSIQWNDGKRIIGTSVKAKGGVPEKSRWTRRQLLERACSISTLLVTSPGRVFGAATRQNSYELKYILASAMYGKAPLAEILPEVRKTGATAIDLWPAKHGNQREQVDQMGVEAFADMLNKYDVQLGGIASYRYGPFELLPQMKLVKQLGARNVALVCDSRGPKNLTGQVLRRAVKDFVEQMKPHHEAAVAYACDICIEIHGGGVIHTPDSLKYFAEFATDLPRLGIAFAPHHLPQKSAMQVDLIRQLGSTIKFFYAQEAGRWAYPNQPPGEALLQLPHRGPLDFGPLIDALRQINFTGYTEIFMHPYPRGIPILDSNEAITAEINHSRTYLEQCLRKESS